MIRIISIGSKAATPKVCQWSFCMADLVLVRFRRIVGFSILGIIELSFLISAGPDVRRRLVI